MEKKLETMRHSLAHIMAAAVDKMYEGAKFGVGPAVDDGFYYDIDFGSQTVSDTDLPKIEKQMRKIIAQKLEFVRSEQGIDAAIDWAKQSGQVYKQELLEDLKTKGTTSVKEEDLGDSVSEVTFYTVGDFTDLCRGPHLANTGEVGVFKLVRVSGAYWRGDESRPQMQRIYGVAFETDEQLQAYLLQQEEAKKRDHRRLGKELDLFTFSDLVGAGLPMFTPRGTVLRDEFAKYSVQLRQKAGFQLVWTPHITKTDLYKTSGHWDKFGEELFLVQSQVNGDEFALKPMNCPHHTQIFASKPRTYRELPIRYMEVTTDYRDEKTGELGGLSRVRSLTQDDSHVFCRHDQIEQEFKQIVAITQELYENIGMKLRARLSYRDDSDQYLGDAKLWKKAQDQIRKVADGNKLDYFEAEGEAAFYGPKIDFMALDALGREFQVSTVQLDFVQPERFGLEYIDDSGVAVQPVMIHYATLGSIERFLSIFIEHTAGKFPVWCAPEQLRVIKVKDDPKVDELCAKVMELAKENHVRATLDDSSNSVGKKIRGAETWKVPYSVVVGDKEALSGELPLRIRGDLASDGAAEHAYAPEQLMKSIRRETEERTNESSL